MNVTLDAYREIRRELAEIETEVSRRHRVKRPIDTDRLIVMWEEFVAEVRTGYRATVYEYCNELASRELLEEIKTATSPATKAFLESLIAQPDDVFRKATVAHRAGWDLSEYFSVGDGWWWLRGPLDLGALTSSFPNAPIAVQRPEVDSRPEEG